jgi:Tfp pilus assembly protein PilP
MVKVSGKMLAAWIAIAFWAGESVAAEEPIRTPSQSTREAIEKFSQTPRAVGKVVESITDTARQRLERTLSGKSAPAEKAEAAELSLPQKRSQAPAARRYSPEGKRDPFRPMNLRAKTASQPRENLSPLERLELGQLKVVGIVWDVKEPRAMIEDSVGLGYIVRVGTPIGSNEGKVKAILRDEVVVEEFHIDFHGNKVARDVSMKLPVE